MLSDSTKIQLSVANNAQGTIYVYYTILKYGVTKSKHINYTVLYKKT